jgi:NAD(P)-dependent dehydrogenase (short-subunit alcohol dehydrogenase family)
MAVVLDVQQTAAVQEAAQYVQRHQGLDVVIYCAGYYKAQRATQFDLQDMVTHQDINYVGALRVLDAVLPTLLHQGFGHISLLAQRHWREFGQPRFCRNPTHRAKRISHARLDTTRTSSTSDVA